MNHAALCAVCSVVSDAGGRTTAADVPSGSGGAAMPWNHTAAPYKPVSHGQTCPELPAVVCDHNSGAARHAVRLLQNQQWQVSTSLPW